MPKIKFTKRFLMSFGRLPETEQEKIKQYIAMLVDNPRHPSLQSKLIQGAAGIYEVRIDSAYRMTYERQADNTVVLRVVGE